MDELTPDSEDTAGLLMDARTGNRRAFDRLLSRHRPALRRFVEVRIDSRMRAGRSI
jgi:hypothetical protein